MIRFVVATRSSFDNFFTGTALGRSLALYYPLGGIQVRIFENNKAGLPSVYNQAIEEAREQPALLVFCHDDLHLCDFFWADRLREGLQKYNIIGLAGNLRRVPRQPAWAFIDEKLSWDARENLSGVVAHGHGFPPPDLSVFGPSGLPVKLLDGLLLACHSHLMIEKGLRFDERFDFHFYDLDFCREAERLGLSMGTWPISVVHESSGGFGGPSWSAGYAAYMDKWKS
jgi:GT2 family glycosyltransferase